MARRHAFLHIGTWKTGTTAIQTQFNELRRDLLNQGFYYFRSSTTTGWPLRTDLVRARRPAPKGKSEDGREPDPPDGLTQKFADEMSSVPPKVDRVIFSDERTVTTLRSPEEVKRLRDFLSPWFDGFSVVLYIRRQDMFAASLYSERLRAGFIRPPLDPRMIRGVNAMGDYHAIVERWSAAFGADAIRLRIYENSDSGERFDAVRDIFGLCGLRPPPPRDPQARRRRPSMNLAGQAILREAGRRLFTPDAELRAVSGQWKAMIKLIEARCPGTGWLPTRSEAAAIVSRFETGNEALRKRYYPERQRLFSDNYDDLPEHTVLPSDPELFESACAILVDMLGHHNAPALSPLPGIKWEVRKAGQRAGKKRGKAHAGS